MQKNDDLDSFYRTIMLGEIDNNTFEEYFQIFAHIHGSRIMVGGLRLLYCFITYINYLFFFFFVVPNSPPVNVRGHNMSSTSILVRWGSVPAEHRNGIIMSYTVTYKELPSGSTNSQKVNAARTQATLTGLKEYTNYSIAVFAATSKGEGNASEPIIVITGEDSRCNLFIVMCLLCSSRGGTTGFK